MLKQRQPAQAPRANLVQNSYLIPDFPHRSLPGLGRLIVILADRLEQAQLWRVVVPAFTNRIETNT